MLRKNCIDFVFYYYRCQSCIFTHVALSPHAFFDCLYHSCSVAAMQHSTQLSAELYCAVVQINGATVVTTLTISVVWIVYSMIPPYLLIHYTWIGRGTTLQFMCRVAFVLSFVTSICAVGLLWAVYPKDYDFGASNKVCMHACCTKQKRVVVIARP